jgi:hypothetical protein
MSSAEDQEQTRASPQRRGRGGRGRGGGGGSLEEAHGQNGYQGRGRGGMQGGRGRGYGRGPREGANNQRGHAAQKGKAPAREADDASQPVRTIPRVNLPPSADDDPDAEVCFICASPVQHTAVAPCNHRTCHICSIRMRALYKTKACAHCRTESEHVILTDVAEKRYEDFTAADFFKSDDNLGIHFENPSVFDDGRLLLQYNCPEADCDVACLGWPDLHRHVKTAHSKVMW